MKVTLTREIDYAQVDPDLNQNLGSFFKLLTEAAVLHSEQVGFDTKTLLARGEVWILNALEAEIYRYPRLREEIRVVTWHRESKGFKAFRDFNVYSGNEKLAAAVSQWLYFDIRKKRLTRVPAGTGRIYTSEAEAALESRLAAWKPETAFAPEFETRISVRASDFDPLNHVTNAVYLDYLETLAARFFGRRVQAGGVRIQYKKEIGRGVTAVRAGLKETEGGWAFKLFDAQHLFAVGDMTLAESRRRFDEIVFRQA